MIKDTRRFLPICSIVWALAALSSLSAESEQTLPIYLHAAKDIVISGKVFGTTGKTQTKACIILDHCTNVTVKANVFAGVPHIGIQMRHCQGVRVTGNLFRDLGGSKPQLAIEIYKSQDVVIQGNRIERVASGAHVLESTGIVFSGNYVEDVLGPMPRGQMVQYDKVFGEGNRIQGNIAINHWNRSHPEDVISIYKSAGTQKDPIVIQGNWIMGDPGVGSQDMSESGSGIMLGDAGGSHIACKGNTLISPGQVGIGVASGGDISVVSNTVLGRRSNRSNVGISVWNQYALPGGAIHIKTNRVAWENAAGQRNSFWQGDAKHGTLFEFKSVAVLKNDWDAWETVLGAIPAPPRLDGLPLLDPGSSPNNTPEDLPR